MFDLKLYTQIGYIRPASATNFIAYSESRSTKVRLNYKYKIKTNKETSLNIKLLY